MGTLRSRSVVGYSSDGIYTTRTFADDALGTIYPTPPVHIHLCEKQARTVSAVGYLHLPRVFITPSTNPFSQFIHFSPLRSPSNSPGAPLPCLHLHPQIDLSPTYYSHPTHTAARPPSSGSGRPRTSARTSCPLSCRSLPRGRRSSSPGSVRARACRRGSRRAQRPRVRWR